MSVGPAEILVILVVALLVFGPQRLPEVGRQVGAAMRELRRMQDAVRGELDMVLHPEHGTRTSDAPAVDSNEPGGHPTYSYDSGSPDSGTYDSGTPGIDAHGTPEVSGPDADRTRPESADAVDDGFAGPDTFI